MFIKNNEDNLKLTTNTKYFVVFNFPKNNQQYLILNQFKDLILNQIIQNITTLKIKEINNSHINIKNYIIFEDSKKYKTRQLFFLYFELNGYSITLDECLQCVSNDNHPLLITKNINYIKSETSECFDSNFVGSCFKNYLPFLSKYAVPKKKFDIIYDFSHAVYYYNQFFPKPKRIKKGKIIFTPNVADAYCLVPLPKLPDYPRYSFLKQDRYPQLFPPYSFNYKFKTNK